MNKKILVILTVILLVPIVAGTRTGTQQGHPAEEIDAGTIADALTIQQAGNVGIGITNPTEALDVAGNVIASGTICDSSGCIGVGTRSPWTLGSGDDIYRSIGNVGITHSAYRWKIIVEDLIAPADCADETWSGYPSEPDPDTLGGDWTKAATASRYVVLLLTDKNPEERHSGKVTLALYKKVGGRG